MVSFDDDVDFFAVDVEECVYCHAWPVCSVGCTYPLVVVECDDSAGCEAFECVDGVFDDSVGGVVSVYVDEVVVLTVVFEEVVAGEFDFNYFAFVACLRCFDVVYVFDAVPV